MYSDTVIIIVLFLIIFFLPASLMVAGFRTRYEQSVFVNWCAKPMNFWQWGIAIIAGTATWFSIVVVVLAIGFGVVGLAFPEP